MIAYFDTSALVPLVVEEEISRRASLLWDEADLTAAVRLVYAEARSALASARRSGRIDEHGLRHAVARLEDLCEQLEIVEASDSLVRRAGSLAEEHALGGHDALHLAAAEAIGGDDLVLVAGDGPLRRAAESIGLAVARL